ncbi:MAG: ornithine carbamoyltransferase [Gammaproteobacteria bacterium]|nr:ornithine carbamoyltransferase [Gammaproteobacteria bacterium]
MSSPRHFLTLLDLSPAELRSLISRAIELKALQQQHQPHELLKNRVLGMVFEKSSTRTRVSFEVAMTHLGGHAIFLSPRDTQLGRGEPVADSARVLSRMVDVIMIRTFAHDIVETFAQHSQVPVINGLTDLHHPCQLLADIQTYVEQRGDLRGRTVTWIGDGNNMCNSYIHAAAQLDFRLHIACPTGYEPDATLLRQHQDRITLTTDPNEAARGADLIVTDVWASMGQEEQAHSRQQAFTGFQVNAALMKLAQRDALFMHCLPAHRGEEVTAEVIDGPQSIVWDEAENRLHAQKALLELLVR